MHTSETITSTTRSSDGTSIAFETSGRGRPLVLVDGAFCSRAMGPGKQLAAALGEQFTVVRYDRRGRHESGDGGADEPRREIDDLAAVLDAVGGGADVFGHSSGAVLALEAAAAGVPIGRLALYEPPLVVDETRPPVAADLSERLAALAAAGRGGAVIRTFMAEAVAAPALLGLAMSVLPGSGRMKKIAHTVAYDARLLSTYQRGLPPQAEHWGAITAPTLVLSGGKSPEWLRSAAAATAAVLPKAQLRVLAGQTHMVKPKATVPALLEFFDGRAAAPVGPDAARGLAAPTY